MQVVLTFFLVSMSVLEADPARLPDTGESIPVLSTNLLRLFKRTLVVKSIFLSWSRSKFKLTGGTVRLDFLVGSFFLIKESKVFKLYLHNYIT